MKLLTVQRWSGIVLLSGLIAATHFLDRSSPHLETEVTFVLLIAAAVVHATTSLYVVGTDYAARPRARFALGALALVLGTMGLGAAGRSIALETRAADTPGHVAGSRCGRCHEAHSFPLDVHPNLSCAGCHDVTSARLHLSRFEAPIEEVMARDEKCASCHAPPPRPPSAPSATPSVALAQPPGEELRARVETTLPEDLATVPWEDASLTLLAREGGAPTLEVRGISTSDRIAIRVRFEASDDAERESLAVLGAIDASPSFTKMGCAASCHQEEKHRTSGAKESLRVLFATPEGGKVLDIDAKGMHPSRKKARIDLRRRGSTVVVDFIFGRDLFDLKGGISIALFDGSKLHAVRTRPIPWVEAP